MKRVMLFLFLFCVSMHLSASSAQTLSLEECVSIALEKNPQILQSEYYHKMAGKDVSAAVSYFLPSVTGSMGYSHSNVGPSSQLRIDPQTGILVPLQPFEIESWQSSARLSVNQPIFNGGYSFFYLKKQKHTQKSAEYYLEDTRQAIIYRVKERYYNLLKQQKLLEAAQQSLKSAEESYKQASAFFEVGKVSKSDVLTSKVQLEESKLSVIEVQNLLSVAKASLNQTLGFHVDKLIEIIDNLNVPEVEIKYEEAMESGMTIHPNLLRGEFDVKAAKAGIGMAVSQFLPSVRAYAGYEWRHKNFDEIKNMLDTNYNWYMGVSLSVPIFQGLSRVAQTSKAKLNLNWSKEVQNETRRRIALEVKESFFYVQQSKRKITVAESSKEAAEENLRLNQEKYNLGAGTILDLINAQVQQSTALSGYIEALYDYKLGVARLQKAMGQLKN